MLRLWILSLVAAASAFLYRSHEPYSPAKARLLAATTPQQAEARHYTKSRQLLFIAQWMEKMQKNQTLPLPEPTANDLVESLFQLSQAKTSSQIAEIGRTLQTLSLYTHPPTPEQCAVLE